MLVEKIEKIIAPKLAILGVEIIRIRLKAGKVLELMIERIDEKNITIDECVNISRHLSQLLFRHFVSSLVLPVCLAFPQKPGPAFNDRLHAQLSR